jgi:NAD(P)-dependent dehydrogenase (short-subunit alcohol dehydrogenase family)
MTTAFVTGANRGIGLEFVRQLSARGDHVYAACRNPDDAHDLKSIGNGKVVVVKLDVTDPASSKAAAEQVEGKVDFLVNNAGTYGPFGGKQHIGDVDPESMLEVFRTNVVGQMLVIDAFLNSGKLVKGGRVVNISSGAGSIEQATGGSPLYYATSKAGLNMATRVAAGRLREKGIVVIAQCPGWVKTDMGGENAKLTPGESVGSMLKHLDKLTLQESGGYFNHRGGPIVW